MGEKWYQQITRGQWLALTAALLGWMFDGFELGIFPLVGRPALIDVLGTTDDARVGPWMAGITAAFLVGAAVGGWVFGWLGDRVGRVRAMVFSVLTYSLFTGLCGLAQNEWHLALLRFLAALGMGGEWALGVALVMECWPGEARPVLAGLIGAAANVGFCLTVFLVMALEAAGLEIKTGGWRWAMGACALPALLTFFIRMFVPESEKWQQATRTGPRPGLADIFTPALRRRTIMGAVLGGVALVGTWGSVQMIPAWVGKITDRNQTLVNYAHLVNGTGAILGSFLGPVLARYGSRRWSYFALCVGSLVSCAILFRGFDGVTQVTASFFLSVAAVGGLTAAFYGWLPLYLPELFPTRVRATGQGFGFNFGRIIAAGGAMGTGYLMSPAVFNGSWAQAGATMSLVYLVGLVVVWLAPETHGQPLPE